MHACISVSFSVCVSQNNNTNTNNDDDDDDDDDDDNNIFVYMCRCVQIWCYEHNSNLVKQMYLKTFDSRSYCELKIIKINK